MKQIWIAALVITMAFAGCTDEGDGTGPDATMPMATFDTSVGTFTIELWPDEAPKTVENFLRYIDMGFYDGLTFHRIAPGFVVQGGGYEPDHETLRPTMSPIVNEADADVPNEQWTLSMARTQAADSATSQFFINLEANPNLDKKSGSAGYAVFGKVVSGSENITAMTEVERGRSFGAGGFWPADPIIIEEATQTAGDVPDPAAPADIHTDLITSGTWHVTNTQDVIFAWARNHGPSPAEVQWSVVGADGPLPDGWNITFEEASAGVGGVGAATDHAGVLVHITVPGDASGSVEAVLQAGTANAPFTIDVDLVHDRVSVEGDSVTAEYRGECVENGEEFDAGDFPVTLGQGDAIRGFDMGLIGLGLGESATLYIPQGHGYGEDRGPCGGMGNGDLVFDVTLKSFDDA